MTTEQNRNVVKVTLLILVALLIFTYYQLQSGAIYSIFGASNEIPETTYEGFIDTVNQASIMQRELNKIMSENTRILAKLEEDAGNIKLLAELSQTMLSARDVIFRKEEITSELEDYASRMPQQQRTYAEKATYYMRQSNTHLLKSLDYLVFFIEASRAMEDTPVKSADTGQTQENPKASEKPISHGSDYDDASTAEKLDYITKNMEEVEVAAKYDILAEKEIAKLRIVSLL